MNSTATSMLPTASATALTARGRREPLAPEGRSDRYRPECGGSTAGPAVFVR
jgi:hypothetical protein